VEAVAMVGRFAHGEAGGWKKVWECCSTTKTIRSNVLFLGADQNMILSYKWSGAAEEFDCP